MIITMLRFVATLLIAVCFTNSAAIRAEAASPLKQGVEHVGLAVQDTAGPSISTVDSDSKMSAPLSDENTNTHSDCDQHAACHHCHLGHCQFLIAATGSLNVPLSITGARRNDEQRFTSLEIPSPIRPPIA